MIDEPEPTSSARRGGPAPIGKPSNWCCFGGWGCAEARAMMGITNGMLRLSFGLEDIADLTADPQQAIAG